MVVNGIMFVTSANDTYALDARTGRTIWHHAWPISAGLVDDASGHLSRGVAVWGSRVYRQTDNAHLLCLDARSGQSVVGGGLRRLEQKLRRHWRAIGDQRQSHRRYLRRRRRRARFCRSL